MTGFHKRKVERKFQYDKKVKELLNEEKKAFRARKKETITQNVQEIQEQLEFMSSVVNKAEKKRNKKERDFLEFITASADDSLSHLAERKKVTVLVEPMEDPQF